MTVSAADSEAEVEPWGVRDAQGWSQRRALNNASFPPASGASASESKTGNSSEQGAAPGGTFGNGSGGGADGEGSAGGNATESKCPDADAQGTAMRAMSAMLPGVGLLSAQESDVVRASPTPGPVHSRVPCMNDRCDSCVCIPTTLEILSVWNTSRRFQARLSCLSGCSLGSWRSRRSACGER